MNIPARLILRQAEATNAALGHVNFGALSESHGFVSATAPIVDLPPPFNVWIEAATALPSMCHEMTVRRNLNRLPLLDASSGSLDDRYLMRASSVLGLLSQAYWNIEVPAPERLPRSLAEPWNTVAWRLGNPRRTMSTTDYMFHNWRLIDPDASDPMRVENLKLLTPVWSNHGTETFMLVVLEMLARSTPLVGAVVRAQEAATRHDSTALKAELALMTDVLNNLTFNSLLKANTNRHCGAFYVDPVVWTKMFATLPLPMASNIHNATGVETPFFHMMDEFLERRDYKTQLGGEALTLRAAFPLHWKQFMTAVRQVSVPDYVRASKDLELSELFSEMREAYQGRHGLLARHRLKAFAFMDAAFKTGRMSTVTGFSGLFKDRAWDVVDTSFENSRAERDEQYPSQGTFVPITKIENVGFETQAIRRVVFDVRGLGIRYQPGDRLAVLPSNESGLVARTLAAFEARGDEEIALTQSWRAAAEMREGFMSARTMRLEDMMSFGHLRPVTREVAKRLHALTYSEFLRHLINDRMEDQWELWDLIERLKVSGFQPKQILSALPGEPHHVSRIVPPMLPRLYSISSAPGSIRVAADEIELTVGQLAYKSIATQSTPSQTRRGTSSSFLCADRKVDDHRVAIRVVHPPRFSLPSERTKPIVMFAAGTGIAPFRGFLQDRSRLPSGSNVLVLSVRDAESIPYREELEALQGAGHLDLHVALSRQAARAVFDKTTGRLRFEPGTACRVDGLLREPVTARRIVSLIENDDAIVYVCGRATFAATVLDTLVELLGKGSTHEEARENGYRAIYRMIGADRYMQDVFTTYTGSMATQTRHVDVSELVTRNTPVSGLWQAIRGRVYDLTRFADMHPGGFKLIQSYAGMDATAAYEKVEHHINPEVDSMLAMFEIGVMRRLDFGTEWAISVGETGLQFNLVSTLFERWVRFLYLFVEIENAYRMEISIKDQILIQRDVGDDELLKSPYKLQFQIQAHHRFLHLTLEFLSEELGKLWRLMAGACNEAVDLRWLRRELATARETNVAREAYAWTGELQQSVSGLCGAALTNRHEHVLALQSTDASLMANIKAALCRGLVAFEKHERKVLRIAGGEILSSLRAIPLLMRNYYDELSRVRTTCDRAGS